MNRQTAEAVEREGIAPQGGMKRPSTATLPIAFAARNPRFVSSFPDGSDQLWMADMKACCDGWCEVFEDVLFVESNGTAFIYGVEFEDGYPKGLNSELALRQQALILFLRHATKLDNEEFGMLAALFDGHEYRNEGKATAAYVAQRDIPLMMGIGYCSAAGNYELIGIDPNDGGWLETAEATLPFDALGQSAGRSGPLCR